MDIHRKVF